MSNEFLIEQNSFSNFTSDKNKIIISGNIFLKDHR